MAQTLGPPRYYRRGLWQRLGEGFRYGGGMGQWAWLLHRVTGLGVLLYLMVHIIDTFFVVASPEEYDTVIGLYGGVWNGVSYTALRWGFRLGELGLIACVLFHALNGLRIIAFDIWPSESRNQKAYFWGVVIAFFVIMVPVSLYVISQLFTPTVGTVTH